MSNEAKIVAFIATMLPTDEEWGSAAGFMEVCADLLDAYGIPRPKHYGPDGAPR